MSWFSGFVERTGESMLPWLKVDRNYVSEEDAFLKRLNESLPLSAAQKAELKKSERISRLRDDPDAEVGENTLWEGF